MPTYILDTNTVIDYFKGEGKVAERLLAVAPREIALPTIAAREAEVVVLGSLNAKRPEIQYEPFLSVIDVIAFDSTISRRATEVRMAGGSPTCYV
jgi:tRNA(fMet)-specific endonuclease VapC